MMQVALINLWKFRLNPENYYTTVGAWKVARNAMRDYLKGQAKFFENDISSNTEIGDKGLTLLDTLQGEKDFANYVSLLDIVKLKYGALSGKHKMVIQMYLNHRSYFEISKCAEISKSTVAAHIRTFRNAVLKEIA
jgi:DNA-directed RNA polymerase specialized sigma24 family protein